MATQPTKSLWNWNTGTNPPTIISYFGGTTTKTGLMPADLQAFIGVPAVIYTIPPTPLTDAQLFTYIRSAEDLVEQTTGVLLTETWVASPPVPPNMIIPSGVTTTSPPQSGMVQGVDYDLADIGYDFFYRRYLMEGWGQQSLRYKPIQNFYYLSFIYPLLNQVFTIPLPWVVEDKDYGMIRIVPSANVQMLPLFALELSFMGFAQSLPQALWMQYTAGLGPVEYSTRFAFMKTLVLAQAALLLLPVLQGSINYGVIRSSTSVDGLRYDQSFPSNGAAYSGLISSFTAMYNDLIDRAKQLVGGGLVMTQL